MKPATFVCVFALFCAGCASNWQSRSASQATIYADTLELPVLWANSTFIGAIDGTAIERGQGYVLAVKWRPEPPIGSAGTGSSWLAKTESPWESP